MKQSDWCFYTRSPLTSRKDLDSGTRDQRQATDREAGAKTKGDKVHPVRRRRRTNCSIVPTCVRGWFAESRACLYMDIADAALGKLLLVTTAAIFCIIVLWVNTYPFLDKDLYVTSLVPDPQWFLVACAVWGLCFVGGLMSFTLYHIYPFL